MEDDLSMSDFVMISQGMELYPRISRLLDIKVLMNCRLGIMGWAILVISFAIKQVSRCPAYPLLSRTLGKAYKEPNCLLGLRVLQSKAPVVLQ